MTDRLREYEDWARACMHVRCGFCRENCPAYSQLHLDSYAAKGKLTILYHWLKGTIGPDEKMAQRVYACTSCGLCDVACGYTQSTAIQEMKAVLFEQGISPPEDYIKISDRTRSTGNPYAEESKEGKRLLQDYPEARKDSGEYGVFFGCTEIYRSSGHIESVSRILRSAEVDFRIVPENICCGSPVLRVGDREQARQQVSTLRETISGLGIEKLIMSCSGCYRALSHDYLELTGEENEFETIHLVQILDDLVREKKLKLDSLDEVVTYHDPCHLGRHSGVFEEPRRVLEAVPSLKLVEMGWNRKTAKCCGAGGGFRAGRKDDAIAIASRRVQEAEQTGASILVTACPFCVNNLSEGTERLGSTMRVMSIEALIAQLVK